MSISWTMKYLGQRGSTLRKLAAVAAIINGAILTLVTFEFYKLGGGENRFAIGNILRWNYLEIEFAPEEGGKRRRFPSETRAFKDVASLNYARTLAPRCKKTCSAWVVVGTAGFEPSESVRRLMYTDWCIVVVCTERASKKRYVWPSTMGENVIFLSPEDQMLIGSEFVDELPWSSYARKNVGYLFAVACGASVIWDSDENNSLKFWLRGASPDPRLEIWTYSHAKEPLEVLIPLDNNSTLDRVFNPYPALGCPRDPCRPRGLPKEKATNKTTTSTVLLSQKVPLQSVGVLQSVADFHPDLDDPAPGVEPQQEAAPSSPPASLYFEKAAKHAQKPILLPNGHFCPTSAKSSLHFARAFFGLYLPVSVPGAISDVVRGYVSEALLHLAGIRVGFLPRPLVVQEKIVPDTTRKAEMDTARLVTFLTEWMNRNNPSDVKMTNGVFLNLAETLWIDLYEAGFVELDDVYSFQKWLRSLYLVGHQFIEQPNNLPDSPDTANVKTGVFNFEVGHSISTVVPDLPENCRNIPSKTFWTSDMHDGCRIDTPSVLAHLGQKVFIVGSKGRVGPYPFVFEQEGVTIYEKINPFLKSVYVDHGYDLKQREIDTNYQFFKGDPVMKGVDGFFCQFPASMCELWMPFNRSIFFTPAHRYNLGRCSTAAWDKLDRELNELSKSRNNLIGAMSRYDVEYLKYYTNLDVKLATAFSGFYTKNNPYKPVKDVILTIGFKTFRGNDAFPMRDLKTLYKRYTLPDLMSHRAMVYKPYSVMSYKLTEFYSLGIPLFMPSPKFFRGLPNSMGADRSINVHFCSGARNQGIRRAKHPGSSHPYSPNIDFKDKARNGEESEMYWLQLADFYDLPHIMLFDSTDDLLTKLSRANFTEIHLRMMRENHFRKHKLLETWCDVIPRI